MGRYFYFEDGPASADWLDRLCDRISALTPEADGWDWDRDGLPVKLR